MNIRKLFISAVAVAALSTSAVQAQEKKGRGPQTPEQQIERLEGAVGSLSADQKAKLKDIYAKAAEKMQAIPQEERREKMGEMMQATRKEVRAVLTAEQQKKFDEMPAGRGQGGGKKKKDN
jgi:Spy/CpxP family protein refolding chaperone